MLGSIAGDIIGSVYEWKNIKTKDFPLFQDDCFFTDDSVLTIATAKTLTDGISYSQTYRNFTLRYTGRGYGGNYIYWAEDSSAGPYNSFGNGSAMRVGPVGWFYDSLSETVMEARKSAEVTHNHPEGIKGAEATASAIFLSRTGKTKEEIKEYIETQFGYNLSRKLDDIRKTYEYDVTCQGSVPEALIAFLESYSFEDAIRNAISIGGDSDTIACITGSIAEAFYGGVPEDIKTKVLSMIPDEFREIIGKFEERRK